MHTRLVATIGLLLASTGCMSPDSGTGVATLSGQAFYRERIAAPPGARFEVILEDASRADAAAERIASLVREDAGQPPYVFELRYDPERIDPSRRYVLRTRLTHRGELLFKTDRARPVITGGAPTTGLEVLMRSATQPTGPAAAVAELVGTYWKLVRIGDAPAEVWPDQREAHLVFHGEENRLAGSDGCNLLSGRWRRDGAMLDPGLAATTMMACPQGREQAARFTDALRVARSHRIDARVLELLDEDGTAVARFEAVALP